MGMVMGGYIRMNMNESNKSNNQICTHNILPVP